MPKRKKGTRSGRVVAKRTSSKKRAKVVPGKTRVSGYYGRYSGDSEELKFHDVDIDDPNIAAGGTVQATSLNLIGQGTTESERIGRKCIIRSINWRFSIVLTGAAVNTSTSDGVRVMLVLDKQCNGVMPTGNGTDILETSNLQSFNNLANKGRFRTLMDRTYDMNAGSGAGSGFAADTYTFGEHIVNDTFFKNVNIPIEFDGTTGVITEVRSNNLVVLLLAQTGLCVFGSTVRLRFEG